MTGRITQYQMISNVLFVCGIVFLILAVILFFRFRMFRLFDKISGHAERKARDKFTKKVHETAKPVEIYESGELDEENTGLQETSGQSKTGEISNVIFKKKAVGHNNAFDILDELAKSDKVYDETGLLNLNQDDETGLLKTDEDEEEEPLTGLLHPKEKELKKEGDYQKRNFTITKKVLISHEELP